ncbi:uncharacterized protein LOC124254094 [Haliotis rubra]|uniref:uncharacterized protein LOC124254094 n=1 Tax=Haliotis rubra TaxID=36100 RepID=UPI001EE559CF|nr:uncharacterized protein LOC124254094 [Haliotis rubra]
MNAKFFITVLVGVTLPSLSLQILVRNCGTSTYRNDNVIVASELSENARAAARTGSNIGTEYQTYTDQMLSFFADASATGVDINVGVVYFSSLNNFQYDGLLRPASVLTNANFPTRSASTGATLIGGLQEIETNAGRLAVNGRRVQLPVIYASQISRRDIDPITIIVSRLRQRNVFVYLFAVGSAVLDSNLDNLRGNLTTVTGRDVVFTVTNLFNLGQEITRQVLECDLVIPNSLCSDCIIEESSALIPHPDRCDKYVQCYIRGNQILTAEFFCPHGTLYDRTLATCQHANTVINDRSVKTGCQWCASTSGRYQYRDSCASYWQCGGTIGASTLEPRCCPQGQRFDSATSLCISDFGCDRTVKHPHASYCKTYFQCNGEELASQCCTGGNGFVSNDTFNDCAPRTDCVDQNCQEPSKNPNCNIEAVGDCQYRQVVNGVTFATQDCPKGQGFSVADCACSIKLPSTVVCPSARINNNALQCKDNFLTTMANYDGTNPYFDDEEPWPWNIKNNNVTKSGTVGGVYDGVRSYLSIPRTAGTGEATKNGLWARVVYQDGTDNGQPLSQPRVLLSNAPCDNAVDSNEDASISVTTTPNQGLVTVRLVTDSGTQYDYNDDVPVSVQLNYNPQTYGPNDKKTVTFLYDNNVLTANLNINGISIDQGEATASATGNSPIGTRSCGLKVGKGDNVQRLFKGTVERVEMHLDCESFPAL